MMRQGGYVSEMQRTEVAARRDDRRSMSSEGPLGASVPAESAWWEVRCWGGSGED
ncbi:hypothetical protein HPP92_028779 [Vanilla planifolia]|uniref:Uncharacterized protein n=1 Tax=Vanilla planifolia TaxID=51239 RepID=A0A835P7Y1_VANPL|nr:hypothetical protein HPP92_028779 [Vanilla planifolia]KAG0446568.1 hypothetical protein HPP92_028768 [Vanilla planifolia]